MFVWPLLKDVLPLCQCAISGRGLEISPRCLPIDEIPSFVSAKRRIYMTATLADVQTDGATAQAPDASCALPSEPKGIPAAIDAAISGPADKDRACMKAK